MVVVLLPLAAAMPMLLEALVEPLPLEEEEDMLHCMAAMVTSKASVVVLLL